MSDDEWQHFAGGLRLSDIETTWRRRSDPLRFTMIYGAAVRRYAAALLRNDNSQHEADDVLQDILTQIAECGFPNFDPSRGKFRHYLKEVLRNAVLKWRRRARVGKPASGDELSQLATIQADAERTWLDDWRSCLLDQALRAFERRQRNARQDNLYYTVVRMTVDHPHLDQRQLAAKASEITGQSLTPEAFRKQLSRARRKFAECIFAEVQQTLDGASPAEVLDELAELGLLTYIRDFLPPQQNTT